MIKKLLQALINYITLPDNTYGARVNNKMAIETVRCKTCRNMVAHIYASYDTFDLYYCKICKTTFSVVKGNQDMSKRNKNKNKKGKGTLSHKGKVNIPKSKTTSTVSEADSWEVKVDCVEQCSKVPDKIIIWIHPLAKRKIDALMEEYKNIEWLAYLLGDAEKREVNDIFIPDQEISAARVDNVVCQEYNRINPIGVIHSHHGMGHSFSGTDHDWINQNHNISLVISHSGIDGQCRVKTECGAFKIVKVDVKLKVNIDFDDKAFLESIKDKLKKTTYAPITYGGYNGVYNGVYGEHQPWQRSYPQQQTAGGTKPSVVDETEVDLGDKTFLTQTELSDLETEIDELDFSVELSLAEELELLDGSGDNLDDKETN